MTSQKSAITRVPNFRAVGLQAGIKQSAQPDLALVLAAQPCSAAAVFTTNQFKAAPVLYDMALLKSRQTLQGVIINAGNANAITGQQGLQDAEQMARLTEAACGLPPDTVFVMSTGIIGHQLPMDKLAQGIKQAAERIQTAEGEQGYQAAQAIMTTDLVPKEAFVEITIEGQVVHIGGMVKGSGMIHPNMATLLGVLTTDAVIPAPILGHALRKAVAVSFNSLTVDGDTSTNDTILVLASGEAGHPPIKEITSSAFKQFTEALTELCITLAKAVAQDGEGATKLIDVTVRRAATEEEAHRVAKAVAHSPLVKTALFGNDPNWGRILAAVGYSGATVEPHRTSLKLGNFELVANGEPVEFEPVTVHNWLADQNEVKLDIDLGVGAAQATIWTCDYSYKYIEINAEYHT